MVTPIPNRNTDEEESVMDDDYGLRLTAKWITPTCQQRGHDVAWEDAVSQLREVYDAQLARAKEPIVLTLAIYRKSA